MKKELISSFRNLETNKELRTAITPTGDILFCLSDVCDNLNIVNASSTKKSLEKEYGGGGLDFFYPLSTSGGEQLFNFIPESHVYFLIFRSTKEEARKFRNWVTEEILPSLRKTGSYTLNSSYPVSPYTPELLAKIKELENGLEMTEKRLVSSSEELRLTKEELFRTSEKLKLAKENLRIVPLSTIAEFYNIRESALKSLLNKLGIELDKRTFIKGGSLYVDLKTQEDIEKALLSNFSRKRGEPNETTTLIDNLPF